MSQPGLIRDDYAGPGGWSEGLRMLGLSDVGIEWDASACATRASAGHRTIRADLATYRPRHGSVWGYIASPPCQTFSAAGKGVGRNLLPELVKVIRSADWDRAEHLDPRTRHVVDAARCASTLNAEWVCMEQVPAVLPAWSALAHELRALGYSSWAGVLNATDYGVPQHRRRAILIASRRGAVVPPVATHAAQPTPSLFGHARPWVTMAAALGWGDRLRPSPTIVTANGGGSQIDGGSNSRAARARRIATGEWVFDRPATTIVGSFRPDVVAAPGHRFAGDGPRQSAPGSVTVTIAEALTLQSFRPDYPLRGPVSKQREQIGNAMPPLLAAHVVSAVTGIPFQAEAAA